MTHTPMSQSAGRCTLAAAAALLTLTSAPAHAQSFASANLTLDRMGNLECVFRETGLVAGTQVTYDCASADVGVALQCFYRNKPVGNAQLLVFHGIHAEELLQFHVKNNGQVNAAVVTNIPESESNTITCTAPSELTATAVRWCTNSIADLSNGVVGATLAELFAQMAPNGTGSVPSCAVLPTLPGTTPGE